VKQMNNSLIDIEMLWNSFDDYEFSSWIQGVADLYVQGGKSLTWVSALLDVSPAELQAVLDLSMLDVAEIKLIGDSGAPRTTWMALASASPLAIKHAVADLNSSSESESPYVIVVTALSEVDGSSPIDRVQDISGKAFAFAAKRGEQFGLIQDKWTVALKKWGRKVSRGELLSLKESGAALSFMKILVENNALTTKDPDEQLLTLEIESLFK